jgi:hypothetical protein
MKLEIGNWKLEIGNWKFKDAYKIDLTFIDLLVIYKSHFSFLPNRP